MNVFEIVKVIQDKITNSTSEEELIFLSKSLENLNLGLVKTVSTYADLLNIKYPKEGELYFVDNEERLYYGFGSKWILVFNQAQALAYTWGLNDYYQLGIDNIATGGQISPLSVIGGFADWTSISAGSRHSAGTRADGTAWAWGRNNYGQLGNYNDNLLYAKSSPVSVIGNITNWISIYAGTDYNIGIRDDGTAWAWGKNDQGQLGDGTTSNRSSPVSIVGGFRDWTLFDSAKNATLTPSTIGLRSNGTLWTWGDNSFYQLGDGSFEQKSSPVSVLGGFADWVAASMGQIHALGVRSNGTLWAWGFNTNGRLGDGTSTIAQYSPVSVVGGFTDWILASAGGSHSVGLRSNGTLWTWGSGSNGRLGDGTAVSKSSPVSVVGGFTDWISISAVDHNLGIRSNGTLWAWGRGTYGRLGDGGSTDRSSPVSVVGGFTDWITASAGGIHSLAIRLI